MWCRKTNYKWLISSLAKVTWNFTNEASSHVRRWRDKKVAVETGFFFFCLLKSARKKKCEGKKKGKNDRESVWDREGKLGAGSENEICRILKKCDEGWVWKPLRQPECHCLLLRALVGNHLTSQFGLPHIRKSKCGGGQKGQGVVRMVWSPSLCSGEEESGERGRGERTWVSSFHLVLPGGVQFFVPFCKSVSSLLLLSVSCSSLLPIHLSWSSLLWLETSKPEWRQKRVMGGFSATSRYKLLNFCH